MHPPLDDQQFQFPYRLILTKALRKKVIMGHHHLQAFIGGTLVEIKLDKLNKQQG
ncbi:hypothetical protein C5167_025432 [Papaver somniferum]|uniref:Uncharacterized protein n=1 Tax=Papaver somniferum TaxID=3469 RepID=A0A4Y7JVD6_PAPSO|nr:hypothetical protein C5167_025432 [Papaver somniferum]